jgi:hypothetical protein
MMPDHDVPVRKTNRRWPAYAVAAGIGIVGILMAHHPMILSGFRRVQVDVGDSRLINYFLEHNYRWYRGDFNHREFWNPPFFYPARNIAAFSDTMLGIAPVYAVFRAAGLAPDTSFQIWMVTLSILNYAVMLHLLRRRLRMSLIAASAGAFLFAFGSPRINMMVQQTQLPQFLSLITVDALFGLFTERAASRRRRAALWLAATAGLLAQLSSGFYTGWFTVFSLGIAAIVAVWMPSSRSPFLATLWRDAPWIAGSAVLGGLVIRPWLVHHMAAARELGPRFSQWVTLSLPHATTWLYMGSQNWLAVWTAKLTGFPGFKVTDHDASLGVGLTTTVVGLAGLYLTRDRLSTRLLATVVAILFLSVTKLPIGPMFLVKYGLILGTVAFAYSGRDDHPGVFILVVGLVLLFLNINRFASGYLLGCGFYTLLIAVAAFTEGGDARPGRLVMGALILGLSYTLVPSFFILGVGVVVGALLAVATWLLGWRSRTRLETVALGGFLLFAVLTSFGERPTVLLFGLIAPPALMAARHAPVRPPARFLPNAAFVGLMLEMFFEDNGTAWNSIYLHVPGASSLLFVSRAGLMLLIPWSIGVGYFIDALLAKNRPALAACVGLICLLEQGVTTGSFDKYDNRETISALARRVDDGFEAFYYSPHDSPFPPFKANLDAMWAGLECGKPTINGYSGSTPYGWRALEDSNETGLLDFLRIGLALDKWRSSYGRSVHSFQWIGLPRWATAGQ